MEQTYTSPAIRLYKVGPWRFLLDPSSLVDRTIIEFGGWESAQIDYLFGLFKGLSSKDDAIFLDVGSYFGLYSIKAVESGMFSEIHAFEPDRRNLGQLYGNIFLNELEKLIQIHPVALSDHIGFVHFLPKSHANSDGNRGGSCIVPESSLHTAYLECADLDSIFTFRNKKILMKLDVEEHEAHVLRGMKNLLQNNKIVLQVEAFDRTRSILQATAEELGLRHLKTIHVDHYFSNF